MEHRASLLGQGDEAFRQARKARSAHLCILLWAEEVQDSRRCEFSL